MGALLSHFPVRRAAVLAALAATVAVGCGPADERPTGSPEPSAEVLARDSARGGGAPPRVPPRFETFTAADGLVSNEANYTLQGATQVVLTGLAAGKGLDGSSLTRLTSRQSLHFGTRLTDMRLLHHTVTFR